MPNWLEFFEGINPQAFVVHRAGEVSIVSPHNNSQLARDFPRVSHVKAIGLVSELKPIPDDVINSAIENLAPGGQEKLKRTLDSYNAILPISRTLAGDSLDQVIWTISNNLETQPDPRRDDVRHAKITNAVLVLQLFN